MRLLLIRHGQTVDNVNGALGTVVPGPGLTKLGQEQASAVPSALSGVSLDAIVVSTMRRTHETAAPLAAAHGIEPWQLDGLQEISAGDLEGRSDHAAVYTYLRTMLEWWDDFDARIPGGESGTEFFDRYDAAVRSVSDRYPEGTVALFSHGAAIRTWASWVSSNIDADFSRANGLENTGIVILDGSPDEGWTCLRWQDTPIGGPALEDESAPDPLGDPE